MRKDLYTNGSVDIPKISKKRSYFDLSHSSHIDMNAGVLYPIDQVIEVVPGDTFDYSHRLNLRMTNPPKTPTCDQLVFDIYFFSVPHRIVWNKFDQFITNKGTSFYTDLSYSYPVMDLQNPGLTGATYPGMECSAIDYLGYGNLNIKGSSVGSALNPSYLPLRGYCKIWNEYFRYETLQTEVLIDYDDTPFSYTNFLNTNFLGTSSASNYYEAAIDASNCWSDLIQKKCYANVLLPVNRLPGYFSRALPQPLAGDDVSILNQVQIGDPSTGVRVKAKWTGAPGTGKIGALNYSSSTKLSELDNGSAAIDAISGQLISSDNSIRALSNAFALNKFLYIDNLYGKRITEWTYGHFGVQVPDSRVQRPEFLGKKRVYVNINQIMQSSETGTSPQGNAGAWSQTFDSGHDFTKSFTEYGYVFALGCIRVLNHSFAQGIDKHWTYKSRFDYYLPEFNNVGDQEVKKYEIFADTSNINATWGYQERYAHLKMIPSRVAGKMRPTATQPLSIWIYTDYYSTAPSLSAEWMFEPHTNIDNTLYLAAATAPSFILDYVADIKAYRSMPYHSMPGGLTGSW